MAPGQRGPVPVVQKDGDLAQSVLDYLGEHDTFNSNDAFPSVSQQEIKASLDRLASRSMIEYQQLTDEVVVLLEEGQEIVDEGSPEFRVWDLIRQKGRMGIKDVGVRGFASLPFRAFMSGRGARGVQVGQQKF
jgi:phenylalanyl-tRNA synthetase alpha chain